MTDKRRKIETLITQVMKDLDPTGINAAKYQNMFVKMSDSQFSQWVTRFLADEKSNLRLDIECRESCKKDGCEVIRICVYAVCFIRPQPPDKNQVTRTRWVPQYQTSSTARIKENRSGSL